MSKAILKNFRGLRALVIMNPEAGRDTLERTLGKLGLEVIVVQPPGAWGGPRERFDLVLFDADSDAYTALDGAGLLGLPLIAVIGSEAPSQLAGAVRHRAASHILKPVRSSGIFTALLLAMNEHAARMRQHQETLALRRRLAGRRVVMKAILELISHCSLTEDDAYEWLRREAMERRIPMEDMARYTLELSTKSGVKQLRVTRPG
ncbi:MAG: ANTAR domain-containing protein [Hoeflea sp.]|uniref:ANTAR domain-containing response regulator n=1 Tax=Hoeflea sp. TaxID=1940281 RepID=UPI001D54CA68|nr:ANTAR domain-containing protein [Hoeflea sp.]MBU4531108.1 ANTAR domain-containing protein [Alphaproteobacteria bacterium]MBU4545992.1 ANTAR domain-containing protein [Alphaproteobacteria bacterium]MBU4549756.1 ANTAR domain-containing protein [Alphaproteobacteria bacterium]MBV1725422.1 ANTAR domain-containing protein [Hoeflea sp.]MBV1761860.1 ANTAR domain-containing protein [Hoeflea sp.]